jgi:hypothetical protein
VLCIKPLKARRATFTGLTSSASQQLSSLDSLAEWMAVAQVQGLAKFTNPAGRCLRLLCYSPKYLLAARYLVVGPRFQRQPKKPSVAALLI